jgi:hypothetical protein
MDIVERLRQHADNICPPPGVYAPRTGHDAVVADDLKEAAAEIEQLRAVDAGPTDAMVIAAERAYFAGEPDPPGSAGFQCMKAAIEAAMLARVER